MKAWQAIWRLLRFSPWLYLLSLGMQILRLGIMMAPGFVIGRLFDALSHSTEVTWGFWGLIALLVAIAAGRVAALLGGIAVESTGYFVSSALVRTNLFGRLLERPNATALPYPPGDLINRLDKDGGMLPEVVRSLMLAAAAAVGAMIAVGVMASIDPLITLIVCVPLLGAGIAGNILLSRMMGYRRRSRAAEGDTSAFLAEVFGAVQALQVAGAERRAIRRLRRLNEARRDAAIKDRLFHDVLMNLFITNIVQFATGLVLLLAGRSMRAGTFSVGDFALFVYLLPQVTEITFYGSQVLAFYKQAQVSLERLHPLLKDAPPGALVEQRPVPMHGHLPDPPPAPRSNADRLERLDVEGLTYHYPDSGRGIDAIDLSLRRGALTVVTGRIGAGKTTLLRTLLGLLPKDAGEIRWNGRPVEDPAGFFVPPRSAYTPQAPHLFSDTLRENILMGLPKDDGDVLAAIRLAAMEQDLAALEDGLDTLIGRRGVKLSGGQVQRAAAARMFVRDPQLLVLDDVSSALDVETEQLLWERLSKIQNRTCLVVSHRRAAFRRADHIIVLRDGKLEAEGTLEQLLASCEEMQRLWQGDLSPSEPGSVAAQSSATAAESSVSVADRRA